MNNLPGTHCSVLFNGQPCGFFRPTRGVKQGDPLSPLLCILASEGFSRGINSLFQSGHLRGFHGGRTQVVSHLGFADDLLIFLNGSIANLNRFKEFLEQYQRVSGQQVNYHRSQMVAGAGVAL